jgi:hypothetical protein
MTVFRLERGSNTFAVKVKSCFSYISEGSAEGHG